MNAPDLDNARFDRRLRAVHAEAVEQVSAATMAQLHQRRAAAVAGRPARRFGWPLAMASAAVLALAVGLGLGLGGSGGPEPGSSDQPMLALDAAPPVEDAYDGLDQSPDFYAWLASSDAELLAME